VIKYKKSLGLLLLISFSFFLFGCAKKNIWEEITKQEEQANINDELKNNEIAQNSFKDLENKRIYTNEEIDVARNDKEGEIEKQLLLDYIDNTYQLEEEFSYYDLSLALIYEGMLDNFLAAGSAKDWLEYHPTAYKYLSEAPDYNPVFSGLSLDDIKYIAISQPMDKRSYDFSEAVDQLRGEEKELEFLEGFKTLADEKGYYVIDLYVEDLLELNRQIDFEGIYFREYESNEDNFSLITTKPDDIELQNYLDKYQREVNYSNELQERKWNLFLFEKRSDLPKEVSIKRLDDILPLTNVKSIPEFMVY
jgi:hypothetical protein